MSSAKPTLYPPPVVSSKREGRSIGSDLELTYFTDLVDCRFLAQGDRYTKEGSFKAGTFLPFFQPPFILEDYPDLFSTVDDEREGLPVILSCFNPGAKANSLQQDWEDRWFLVIGRVCPNRLHFEGVPKEDAFDDRVSIAMTRDGALFPYVYFPGLFRLSPFFPLPLVHLLTAR